MSQIPRTRAMQVIERRINRPLDEALREMYVDRRMTLSEIADEWGAGLSTISDWLRTFGIEARYLGNRRPATRERSKETVTA